LSLLTGMLNRLRFHRLAAIERANSGQLPNWGRSSNCWHLRYGRTSIVEGPATACGYFHHSPHQCCLLAQAEICPPTASMSP
jgi:hypothetical protein